MTLTREICLTKDQETFNGVCAGTRALIIYAVGEDSVITLKKKYVGYGKISPKQMMKHLRSNISIKITTKEKVAYKRTGFDQDWDQSKHVSTYLPGGFWQET